MKVNTYENGETFIYNDKNELVLAFYPSYNGQTKVNVYVCDFDGIATIYSRHNGTYKIDDITND